MRSGSTMLRLILDSHPSIAIGPETGFMGAVAATKRIPNFKAGAGWYERLNWTEQEIDARLRDFYDGIFARYAAQQGKARWGEKTPFHTTHMEEMATLFPTAVFVGIVRHPGAVASSLQRNFHYSFPEAVSYWRTTNLRLVDSAALLGDRALLCRYEDLVRSPEPVLRELVSFLGEPWSPVLLEHHTAQAAKGAPRVTDGSTVTREPIDSARAEDWVAAVTPDEIDALDAAAALAGFLGYGTASAVETSSLPGAAPGAVTARGTGIAARRAALGGPVDVAPPKPVIDADREELVERLLRAEAALRRTRSRRAVRLADTLRRAQQQRSWSDLRAAWSLLRRGTPSR
jgi:Sulfotransferase family